MKKETLKSFIDVPEKIEEVKVTKSDEKSVSIEWVAPESNNAKITLYKIYIKKGEEPFREAGSSAETNFDL